MQLDPSGISDDPAFRDDINKVYFNAGAGIYYNSDRFYAGLSSPELLNLTNPLRHDSTVTSGSGISDQELHLFLAGGYVFPLGTDFNLKSSFLIKGVRGAPVQGDINLTLWIKDILAIGAQYRTEAAVAGMLELQVTQQLRLGYAYDYSTNNLKNYNTGSHEIMLRYEFGFNRSKIISPRYF